MTSSVIYYNTDARKNEIFLLILKSSSRTIFSTCHVAPDLKVVSLQADASYNGYLKHLEHQAAPPPLTNAEEELQMVKESEVYLVLRQTRILD